MSNTQNPTRTFSSWLQNAWMSQAPIASSSATPSGTYWLPDEKALSVWACSLGGYGQEDLERAGAFRVYSDPADLLAHIEQLGIPGT